VNKEFTIPNEFYYDTEPPTHYSEYVLRRFHEMWIKDSKKHFHISNYPFRAVLITTCTNIDYPYVIVAKYHKPTTSYQKELIEILADKQDIPRYLTYRKTFYCVKTLRMGTLKLQMKIQLVDPTVSRVQFVLGPHAMNEVLNTTSVPIYKIRAKCKILNTRRVHDHRKTLSDCKIVDSKDSNIVLEDYSHAW
jgi:hypothetical protein